MTKAWWKSKTLWFNVLTGAVMLGQGQLGIHIPVEVATPIISGGNLALRLLTKQPLGVTDQPGY